MNKLQGKGEKKGDELTAHGKIPMRFKPTPIATYRNFIHHSFIHYQRKKKMKKKKKIKMPNPHPIKLFK